MADNTQQTLTRNLIRLIVDLQIEVWTLHAYLIAHHSLDLNQLEKFRQGVRETQKPLLDRLSERHEANDSALLELLKKFQGTPH